MVMRLTTAVSVLLVLAVGHAHAQDGVFGTRGGGAGHEPTTLRSERQAGVAVIALDPVKAGRPVLNAPYSADATTEVTQVLADGNRLEQRTSAKVARDSRGRTRREQQGIALGSFMAQGGEPIVTITDPAAGTHITLNYAQKVAFRSKLPRELTGNDTGAEGPRREAAPPLASRSAGVAQGGPPKLETRPFDTPPLETVAPPSPPRDAVGRDVGTARAEGRVRSEALETEWIESLRAERTRTVMTIPADTIGNTRAIEVISEQWYSPDLDVVLLTRRSDPRFGETVYRLSNIDRSEPAPELFKVPSGFRTEDVRPEMLRRPNEE